MRLTRSILVCALLLVVSLTLLVIAQSKRDEGKGATEPAGAGQTGDQIEVKEDRFSGAVTIKLKPQVIYDQPDHQMTMAIETKLGEVGRDRDDIDTVNAIVKFDSQTKTATNYGDKELHFLIDGKPLNFGRQNLNLDPSARENLKPGFKISGRFLVVFDRPNVAQFGKANRIEMRFGPIECVFPQPVVALLREYCAKVLARHKIIKEKKQ